MHRKRRATPDELAADGRSWDGRTNGRSTEERAIKVFEAYGWANLGNVTDLVPLQAEIARVAINDAIQIQLIPRLNWAGAVVTVAACRNHRYEPVIELFRWLASNVDDAHGVLFVRDQESEHDNEFRVWRLARGVLADLADPFLSPCVPTIEPPWEPKDDV